VFELSERFRHKIKTSLQLSEIIGQPPRNNRVIMCHGVFDVVHPGHLRHLLFAKNKAPTLIVSITADQHINKGKFRPHIPEDLRALNLAALEFVDYVVIDQNETPLQNISLLKPDLFAKGYEYSPNQQVFPRTSEEIREVQSYGGEVIFSPGDFVLSSSAYIKNTPPDIKLEKLLMLMHRAEITFEDLETALGKFEHLTIHVVGDTIVDTQTKCAMIGGHTKTPTMSVLLEESENFVGGAGIVAAHLRKAGAKVKFTTVLGDDALGVFTRNKLAEWGITDLSIIDGERPTTNKNAIVVGNYRLLKIDTVDNQSISDHQLQLIASSISRSEVDAFVFSDFRHGIFNKRTIPLLKDALSDSTYKVADSQVASRWGNILDFADFDLVTPNEREVRFSLGDQDSGIRSIATEVFIQSRCKMLIMKLGERGIITCTNKDAGTLDSYFVMDSFVTNLVDPVGAGDALLAYSTLAMLSTKNSVIASILGNLAAACECERDGNIPIAPEDVSIKLRSILSDANYGEF